MSGEGFNHHGPNWEKVRRSVKKTANIYLNRFYGPSIFFDPSEADNQTEKTKTVKMFNGLYKKISEQRSKSADLIRLQRAKRWNEKSILLAQIERE